LLCTLAVLTLVQVARAQEPRDLNYDLRVDLPLTLGAATLWGAGYLARDQLTPKHCHWCDDNSFDRAARTHLLWTEPQLASHASDIAALVVMPAVAFGGLASLATNAKASRYIWKDALFVFEALSVAALVNQITKFAVARDRPYSHYDEFDGQTRGSFERTSFYSAHANRAFALASAAGMVASLRGYRFAPLLWIVGMASASFVAYTRVASDNHYLSDVLVGGALGSLFGAGVPWLLHRPKSESRRARRAREQLARFSAFSHGVTWTLRQ
jgi:membrane-associated phospholipid phosphatase